MEQDFNSQELGNNKCPILNKKSAALLLGISDPQLTSMEEAGLVLKRYLPGLKRPVYLRGDIEKFYHIYTTWCAENPERVREMMS